VPRYAFAVQLSLPDPPSADRDPAAPLRARLPAAETVSADALVGRRLHLYLEVRGATEASAWKRVLAAFRAVYPRSEVEDRETYALGE